MKANLKKSWERASTYTLAVAETMPEKGFEYKPTSGVWNFRELIHHIAYALDWMNQVYVEQKKVEWDPPQTTENKKDTLSYLKKSIQKVSTAMEDVNSEKAADGFYFMLEHNAHHRGQAVTYLRCSGLSAPEFPF